MADEFNELDLAADPRPPHLTMGIALIQSTKLLGAMWLAPAMIEAAAHFITPLAGQTTVINGSASVSVSIVATAGAAACLSGQRRCRRQLEAERRRSARLERDLRVCRQVAAREKGKD